MAERRTIVAGALAGLVQRLAAAESVAVGWGSPRRGDRRWLAVDPADAVVPSATEARAGDPPRRVAAGGHDWRVRAHSVDEHLEVVVGVAPAASVSADDLTGVGDVVGTVLAADLGRAWLDEAIRRSTELVVVRDPDLRIRWASPQVTTSLGWRPEELVGSFGDQLAHPDELEDAAALLVEHATGRGDFPCRRFRLAHREGGWRWFELTVSNLLEDPAVGGFVVVGRDVSAEMETTARLEAALERLSHAAHHDPLTRLPNRLALTERLRRVAAGDVGRAAILFCDLDGFKEVNDDQGHEAGDRLLGIVGAHVRAAVRAEDLVARYGGDEFVVVAGGLDEADAARQLGERILAAVERAGKEGGGGRLSASIGVVMVEPGRSADDLLRAADAAMYAAKFRGGGRVWASGS